MTAPPDRLFAGAYVDALGRAVWVSETKDDDRSDVFEYVLLDGPTMQAAIAAARAEGREQGLRDAAELAGRWFNQWSAFSMGNEPTRDDRAGGITYGRIQAANTIRAAILALIPAPPADGGDT